MFLGLDHHIHNLTVDLYATQLILRDFNIRLHFR